MERKYSVLFTFAVLFLIVLGMYGFTNWFSKITGYFTGEGQDVQLGKCLYEKGAEIYVNENCARCEEQENILGDGLKFIKIIDCSKSQEMCANLREIPAIYFNGTFVYGVNSIENLKTISGCE
jgi:hypothetical protein